SRKMSTVRHRSESQSRSGSAGSLLLQVASVSDLATTACPNPTTTRHGARSCRKRWKRGGWRRSTPARRCFARTVAPAATRMDGRTTTAMSVSGSCATSAPRGQLELCVNAHRMPTAQQLTEAGRRVPESRGVVVVDITERAAIVSGLATEQPRYYLQHTLGF